MKLNKKRDAVVMLIAVVLAAPGIMHVARSYAGSGESAKLPNCLVMDEPVSLSVSTPTDDGPVYFCCEGCIKKYLANPEKYAEKVADQRKVLAARAKVQVVCPVSGEPTDTKVFTEDKNGKVHFCCNGCKSKYEKDPAKYKTALANSYSFQTKCPVMGEGINPQVTTTLATGETLYFCCPKCIDALYANPKKYVASLESQGIALKPEQIIPPAKDEHAGHDHAGHDHAGHDHD